MEYMLIGFVWVLNFAISGWNAYVTGKVWPYTKQMGGWYRLLTWCGFVMSGCGFSWCFLLPLALLSYTNHWFGFNDQALLATVNLGYIVLAPMMVLSGLFIWLDSLAHAWRERTLGSMAVAGWNTFAQIHNTIEVFRTIGPAFENVSDFIKGGGSSDDSGSSGSGDADAAKAKLVMFVIAIVVVSITAGFLLTTAIVVKVARNEARHLSEEMSHAISQKQGPEVVRSRR